MAVRSFVFSISDFIVLEQGVGPVNHSTPNGHLVTKQEQYLAGKGCVCALWGKMGDK